MALDLTKLKGADTSDTVASPRDIFHALVGKDPKYSYLRDVQTEVLEQWFAKRKTRDLRIKMNTGGGKTVVGLLLLKSCLNEQRGPAVYVAPTPYLASQVVAEAAGLRIGVNQDPRAISVARGKDILVTSIKVLLNGLSKFGVRPEPPQIPIGSLVIDDAHACVAAAEEQFTLTLPWDHAVYKALFDLFKPDLEMQSATRTMSVQSHEPHQHMVIPFWAWRTRLGDVQQLLHEAREDDKIKFPLPLLRETLGQCRCVFGDSGVEISPRCLPVSAIPSFASAGHRVFMSATFADDSVLVTHFGANPDDIKHAIAPGTASDIGDRMILVPQELDPSITDEQIKEVAVQAATHRNVVVIVPSHYRAQFWQPAAMTMAATENPETGVVRLEDGVQRLRSGHVGLTVLVNRYDGIDLPQDACRLLILDGVPDVRRTIDEVDQSALYGTPLAIGKSIQQIEQGMGRGVRAQDDYCVVLLMGRSLVGHLFTGKGISRFTPATRAQFDLSEQVGDQIRGQGIGPIVEAMNMCLSRDAGWMRHAKGALVHVKHQTEGEDVTLAVKRRAAFDAAALGSGDIAVQRMREAVNAEQVPAVRGWLMAELAEYMHTQNPAEAQNTLRAAVQLNHQLPLRPQQGVEYVRLSELAGEQAVNSINYLKGRFGSSTELMVAANAVAEELAFRPDTAKRFERAFSDAARFIGFGSQLPEAEFGAGPDVLWAVGGLRYFVIECKNGAVVETVAKAYCNQLAGSCNWFKASYDQTCTHVPVLIHPSSKFEHAATPPPGARMMTEPELAAFRAAFLGYCGAVSKLPGFGQTGDVARLLGQFSLLRDMWLGKYTIECRAER